MSAYIDQTYINRVSPTLRNFKWKNSTLANCSCPICGDSQKNKTKARGYFYCKENSYFYKCHNCGFGSNLHNFLKKISHELAKEYSLERWKSGKDKSQLPKKDNDMFNILKQKCDILYGIYKSYKKDTHANFVQFFARTKYHWSHNAKHKNSTYYFQ